MRVAGAGFAFALSVVLLSSLGITSCSTTSEPEARATIQSGALQGTLTADGMIEVFRGIPYAAPPVGDLRWKPPVSIGGWDGVRAATGAGPACMQPIGAPEGFYTIEQPHMSEDCLYLNVWAPKNADDAPVLVWIHGGALINGASTDPWYDGARLAAKGVVVVTINYRLNVFGFFSHPGLSAESPQNASGNQGTLDQIAALEWVRDNIEAFGGDPDRVTIIGESAGGLSTVLLMASPLAEGLFHGAIAQSVYIPAMPALQAPYLDLPPAERSGMAFGEKLGASRIDELRALPAEKLLAAAFDPTTSPGNPTAVVDGWVQVSQLFETFETGRQAKVPFVAGFNSGELRAQDPGALPPFPATSEAYTAHVKAAYSELASEFLRLYPAQTPSDSSYAAARDANYGWAVERLIRSHRNVTPNVWMYYFDHVYPSAAERGLGAFHASDIFFNFGLVGEDTVVPKNFPSPPDRASDRDMAETIMDYWVAFAGTGRPEVATRPVWKPFDLEQKSYLILRDGVGVPARDLLPGMYELQDAHIQRLRAGGKQWTWANTGIAAPPR